MMMRIRKNKRCAFTLVEFLVAMSVFVLLFVGAIGTYLRTLKSQRFLSERILINNNAGLVLEQMARELRTGYFDTAQRITGTVNSLTFTSGQEIAPGTQTPVVITYALNGENVVRTSSIGGASVMNSDFVSVKKLSFQIIQETIPGVAVRDVCLPPRFVIRMEVKSKNLEREMGVAAPSSFLQTTVSSRVLPREIQTPNGADPYHCKDI